MKKVWQIIGLVLALGATLLISELAQPQRSEESGDVVRVPVARPIFGLEEIMGAEVTIAHAEGLRRVTQNQESFAPTRMMVVPHHAYVADAMDAAWQRLRATADPSVIVLVGPNHGDLGTGKVQTTNGMWTMPMGTVSTDEELVHRLRAAGAELATEVFRRDHSIGVHIPYIAALFPDAKLVPIVFNHYATEHDAVAVLDALLPQLPDDAVIVYSIDFSHYLPAALAREKDITTFAWMTTVPHPAELIDAAGADHFDSHAAVNMFLDARERFGCNAHVTWYGNSGDIAGDAVGETTSYFVWMCDAVAYDEAVVIHAGGDVMLDRSIERVRRRYGPRAFMHDIAVAMQGGDVRFANLESVVSDAGFDSGKEISFRAGIDAMADLVAGNFSVLSVSNNHALDWGRAAWDDSVRRIKAIGILPVGGFTNFETLTAFFPEDAEGTGDPTAAFLGFNTVDRLLTDEVLIDTIRVARKMQSVVIVSFHWGEEYQHLPTAEMERFAHLAIDSGASLVLGHHPHVLQGFEVYKGKLIAYSLGNLVFDQVIPGTHDSLVARIVLLFDGSGTLELVPLQIDREWVTRFSVPSVRSERIRDVAGWSFGELVEDLSDGRAAW